MKSRKTLLALMTSSLLVASVVFAQDPAEKAASTLSTSPDSGIKVGATPPPLDSTQPVDAPEKQEYELEKAEAGREKKIPL
ncbi:MAG TPA: hypothetical protein VM432_09590, partial [Bdellovibrionales bacterium]|nr:hypothetical protein [Bdellovibrionales bacterium]